MKTRRTTMNNTLAIPQNDTTIQSYSFKWNEIKEFFLNKIQVSEMSKKTYNNSLNYFFNYFNQQQEQFPTVDTIDNYLNYLKEKGLKPTTQRIHIATIKRFFGFLSNRGIFPNITTEAKAPKVSTDFKKDCLTVPQIKEILSGNHSQRDKLIFLLGVSCGLRGIEIERLNKSDLQMRGTTPILWIMGKGRTEKEFITIPSDLYQMICNYIATSDPTQEAIFTSNCNRTKERLSRDMISRIVKRLMREHNINDSRHTLHSLRHTTISLALEQGEELRKVQQLARHKSINTTLIYAHDLERQNNTCSETVMN